MKALFDFYKTVEGSWFIDLPEYPGPKSDLQMVEGADDMLDYLVKGAEIDTNKITLYVSDTDTPYYIAGTHFLDLIDSDVQGEGWYMWNGKKIWLCPVTLYVFGNYPETIYVKVI